MTPVRTFKPFVMGHVFFGGVTVAVRKNHLAVLACNEKAQVNIVPFFHQPEIFCKALAVHLGFQGKKA